MSLLTIHPKYLDKQSLFSLWREGLNAQKAILSPTCGNPTQKNLIEVFKNSDNPKQAIGSYLSFIAAEGCRRGYKLRHEKIICPGFEENTLKVNNSQIIFDINHLKNKLKIRDKTKFKELKKTPKIELNPIFDAFD